MRNLLLLGAAVLALTACSKGADSDGDGKVTTAEASKEMASGGAIAMKPGQWEMKLRFDSFDAPGIPAAVKDQMKNSMGQGMTVTSCLTKEQAEKPGTEFFGGDAGSNCTFQQLDRSGNNMSVQMTCKPAANTTIVNKMQGSFQAESYSMAVDQKISGAPMGEMSMKGKIEGKRLGDCPA